MASVQIILNAVRHKPLERVLPAAAAAGVGIIARVPLASGLLSGRYDEHTTFAADDHRNYNRHGAAFDVGETFSGVDFDLGSGRRPPAGPARRRGPHDGPVRAALGARPAGRHRGHPRCPRRRAGPGATPPRPALSPLTDEQLAAVREIYDELIRPQVHDRW